MWWSNLVFIINIFCNKIPQINIIENKWFKSDIYMVRIRYVCPYFIWQKLFCTWSKYGTDTIGLRTLIYAWRAVTVAVCLNVFRTELIQILVCLTSFDAWWKRFLYIQIPIVKQIHWIFFDMTGMQTLYIYL